MNEPEKKALINDLFPELNAYQQRYLRQEVDYMFEDFHRQFEWDTLLWRARDDESFDANNLRKRGIIFNSPPPRKK